MQNAISINPVSWDYNIITHEPKDGDDVWFWNARKDTNQIDFRILRGDQGLYMVLFDCPMPGFKPEEGEPATDVMPYMAISPDGQSYWGLAWGDFEIWGMCGDADEKAPVRANTDGEKIASILRDLPDPAQGVMLRTLQMLLGRKQMGSLENYLLIVTKVTTVH